LKSIVKKWLTGLSLPQEYVCIDGGEFSNPLSVWIKTNQGLQNITERHFLVGYSPLVLAISDQQVPTKPTIELSFRFGNDEIASLVLSRIEADFLSDQVGFYKGESGTHKFLPILHQRINRILENRRKKPAGNIGLPSNLYDQVRIAYAVPRVISLISVFDGTLLNIFPTDLHGAIGTDYYVGSLRLAGLACKQVLDIKKIVISEISSTSARDAYAMGKNHMKLLRDASEFTCAGTSSKFRFPLPISWRGYRELTYHAHFDVGVHRIIIYKVLNRVEAPKKEILNHIHTYYAQWRINNGLATEYLLR
jgi:hypothetical protein